MSERELQRRLAECDEVLREVGASADPVAIDRIVVALRDKARIVGELGRHGDALALWDVVLERYAEDPPAGLELIALEAEFGKASELEDLEQDSEALATCDELLSRWSVECDDDETRLSDADTVQRDRYLAAALGVKRRIYAKRRLGTEALLAADQLIAAYAESSDGYLRGLVASALLARVYWSLAEGHVDAALGASELLIERFTEEEDPESLARVGARLVAAGRYLAMPTPRSGWGERLIVIPLIVASALRLLDGERRLRPRALWSGLIERRRRVDQAGRIFELLIDRFDHAEDPELALLVARAHEALVAVHVMTGHFAESGQVVDRLHAMGEPAIRLFRGAADTALARETRLAGFQAAASLLSLAFVYQANGQHRQAAAACTECIDRFRADRSALQLMVLLARIARRASRKERAAPRAE